MLVAGRRQRPEQAGDDVPTLLIFERQARHAAGWPDMERILEELVERPRRPFLVEIDQRHLVGQQRRVFVPRAMADGAAGPLVDVQAFCGIRIVRLRKRPVVEGSRHDKKMGDRRGRAVAFAVGKAGEHMRHGRARFHDMGLFQIVDHPLRPEPPADLVEQGPLLGQQVRGRLLAGGVAVHAAQFTQEKHPALDRGGRIASGTAKPLEAGHDRRGNRAAAQPAKQHHGASEPKKSRGHAIPFSERMVRNSQRSRRRRHNTLASGDLRP